MNRLSRFLVLLVIALPLLVGFVGCEEERVSTASTAGPPGPLTEVDVMINDYEKAAKEYVKVAKKFKGGDVSVTIHYLDLGKSLHEKSVKLQPPATQLNPQQTQRVASISATTAPFLIK